MTFEDTLEQVNTKLEQTVEEIKAGRRGRGRKTLTAEEAGVMRRTPLDKPLLPSKSTCRVATRLHLVCF